MVGNTSLFSAEMSHFKQAEVCVNFGPSFILRHDIYGANAISEVQPMSPEDRKVSQTDMSLCGCTSWLTSRFLTVILLLLFDHDDEDFLCTYVRIPLLC